jgi:DMSO reductase anchor subunit
MEKLLHRKHPFAGRNISVTAVLIFAINTVRVTGNVYTCSTVCTHDHHLYTIAHYTQVHVGLNLQFPASLLGHRESIEERTVEVQTKIPQEDTDRSAYK